MADAPTLSPDAARSASTVARTLVAAARSWALYPPEHPAVAGALERFRAAITETGRGGILSFGVTPDTLLIAGALLTGGEAGGAADAARWLHDRDILQLTFVGDVGIHALQRLLAMLSEDPRLIRQRGGPARVWTESGDAAVAIQQIDFSHLLQDRTTAPSVRRKDDLWRSIVRGALTRTRPSDAASQTRLLDIAADPAAIAELAGDVIAPHHAADGSPMLTSQAAAVVTAYRHLVGIVDVLSPDRRHDVMRNIAAATATLDARVVMQMLGGSAEVTGSDGSGAGIVSGIIEAMDDTRVAELLATTLAIEGQASQRLATVFNTIVTDEDRKRRVLALTRRMLGDTPLGRRDAFASLGASMEALLLTYNERPFVSDAYRAGLDGVGARAEQMAAEVPADLAELIDTLGQDNVRRLSVTLLIDLLRLEDNRARAPELARDVAALVEDLLLAGDYESALAAVSALRQRAAEPAAATHEASRLALDGLTATAPFQETAGSLGEMTDVEAGLFARICAEVGPGAIDALSPHLASDELTTGRARAADIVRRFGVRAVGRLGRLIGSPIWTTRRNAADLLGDLAVPEGVPLLQPLLRGGDARVTRAAVRALSAIADPAAARAIHTALRAATGEQRRAVVDALVAQRDARVVPVLVRILQESDALGADHPIVIDTLEALAQVGDDQAVPAVTTVMRRKTLLARRRLRAVKTRALAALRGIRTADADRALADAAASGDRMLRKLARARI